MFAAQGSCVYVGMECWLKVSHVEGYTKKAKLQGSIKSVPLRFAQVIVSVIRSPRAFVIGASGGACRYVDQVSGADLDKQEQKVSAVECCLSVSFGLRVRVRLKLTRVAASCSMAPRVCITV